MATNRGESIYISSPLPSPTSAMANSIGNDLVVDSTMMMHDEVDFIANNNNNNNNNSNNNNNNNNRINYDIVNEKLVTTPTTFAIPLANTIMDISNKNAPTMQFVPNNKSNNNAYQPKNITTQQQQQHQQQQQSNNPTIKPNIENTIKSKTNQTNNNNSKKNNDSSSYGSIDKQEQNQHQHQHQHQQKDNHRLSLFSFSKKFSQKNSSESKRDKPSFVTMKSSPLLLPPKPPVPIGTPPRQHKFVKSTSIARLLGNTYNAKKFEKEEQRRLAAAATAAAGDGKFHTYSGNRRQGPYLERFKRVSKEDGDQQQQQDGSNTSTLVAHTRDLLYSGSRNELIGATELPELAKREQQLHNHHHHHHHYGDSDNMGTKAIRTISRGLGKLWWKRTHSVDISSPDPEFKVSYLGNVLTGWAKGEGCVEKQLNTLWRNYTQNNKPDVLMRIKVCASGLKATTRQHGLTEYWSNRITYCCAPKNYPRVVCWIYRHEGRKLKHELRCHAVLCSKEKIALDICETLKENLESALREFKREKILKQNARLSLANAVYDNPSLPRRKIMLSVGGNNYRPPLERSKSAPKLMAIEEAIGEEDGDEIEETNEPEMRPCCQKDSLYPAMTLGRRRCRRGHSIRRTGQARPTFASSQSKAHVCCGSSKIETKIAAKEIQQNANKEVVATPTKQYCSDGSDSDDFDKLLKYNNYDADMSLSTELLPYFDMQLHKNTSQSLVSLSDIKDVDDDEAEPLSLLPTINSDPSADPNAEYATSTNLVEDNKEDDTEIVGLRRNGVCSDGEEDYLDDADDMYFRQAAILNMLHRHSMRKMANLSLSSDENSSIETNASSAQLQYRHQQQSSISSNSSSASGTTSAALAAVQDASSAVQRQKQLNPDSDEGSISSGCETASTVTANQDDISLKYRQLQQQLSSSSGLDEAGRLTEYGLLDEVDPNANGVDLQDMYQRLESRLQQRHNSDATTYSSSSSITLKMSNSPANSISGLDGIVERNPSNNNTNNSRTKRTRKLSNREQHAGDSDSECSDESGYVEFQDQRKSGNTSAGVNKPHPPPKPMPRRLLNNATGTAV